MTKTDVVIVGGGAVGLCCAWYLRQTGRDVTVVEAGTIGVGASAGNAGMIVPSHIVPLAAPGVIGQGLRWLLNASSPFYIKPRLDLGLLRWLWQFRAHCTAAHVARSIPVLRDLSLASVALFDGLRDKAAIPDIGWAQTGLMMLHRTAKSEKANRQLAQQAEEAGLRIARLDRDAALAYEPHLKGEFTGGVLFEQDGRVDPDAMLSGLKHALADAGVTLHEQTQVRHIQAGGSAPHVQTSAGNLEAAEVVIAAGAWSPALLRRLGRRLPVQPAKGYSLTVDTPAHPLRTPLILTDDKVTVTPMPGKIRFAGTLALAGFDPSVDAKRAAPIRAQAQLYVPEASDLTTAPAWSGYRPCSPDGLPFIGRVPGLRGVSVATGHGMMGVTLAPITGRLIADELTGLPPTLPLTPFAVDRL
ncbi:MAG: FAD-dependent oxidoreductase [Bacteroidota bacterium]